MISQLEAFIRRVLDEYDGSRGYTGSTQDPDYLQAMAELNAFINGEPPARTQSPSAETTVPLHLHQDYQALEVAVGAPFADVAAAYKRLAHSYHPDRWASVSEDKLRMATEIFTRISASFQRIKEFEARRY